MRRILSSKSGNGVDVVYNGVCDEGWRIFLSSGNGLSEKLAPILAKLLRLGGVVDCGSTPTLDLTKFGQGLDAVYFHSNQARAGTLIQLYCD
ncbi:hypothetical protein ACRALDRAFT_212696 [Sodiomyces alcalophilus JCM 7366]|uniref:uncharacterized protein n=1 Tax=Sodiomyces alcalophilus JCM 7366 TaxID=591952 RepID=UPI0039B4F252